jgi:hypothetical protein
VGSHSRSRLSSFAARAKLFASFLGISAKPEMRSAACDALSPDVLQTLLNAMVSAETGFTNECAAFAASFVRFLVFVC